jgi:hypothetical protein
MLRELLARKSALLVLPLVVSVATLTTSCGGSSGGAKPMVLVQFLFLDRALNPTAPTGTGSLPRNAILAWVFSELVDPASVDNQTIQLRFGPTGQSVPQGSFSFDGNSVLFDPTVTSLGQPNPFGLEPETQFTVDLPNYEEQDEVVRNADDDPLLVSYFTTFRTASGYIRELIPPSVVGITFIPDPCVVNPLTCQVPGNGIMGIEFSEAMDPASFSLAGPGDPNGPANINAAVDIRYKPDVQINIDSGLVDAGGFGKPIPGFFTSNAAATIYFFNPAFSFGDGKYVFDVRVRQGLKDLSGNQLVNPRSFPGPSGYTVDGTGLETGFILFEGFDTTTDIDFMNTDSDWGVGEESVLQGAAITTRNALVLGRQFHKNGAWGQYFASPNPLIGAKLNTVPGVPTPNPPTAAGRRVLLAFTDVEMGASGAVTAAGWGPDSNAIFSAIYPEVFLRAGHQKQTTMNLGSTFSGNYEGQPAVLFTGQYNVGQAANIGNTPGWNDCPPTATCAAHDNEGAYNVAPPCSQAPIQPHNYPLFWYTGFYPWPTFSNFFEWQDKTGADGDRVFLWDMSVREGDTWQQIRGWFAFLYPCAGWNAIPPMAGFPNRHLYSVFEGESPNPIGTFANGLFNPEPSVLDTSFTITKRTSRAQTLFYTDGNQGANSVQNTFPGKVNNFLSPVVNPAVQVGGTSATIQFQACDIVDNDRRNVIALPGSFFDGNGNGTFEPDGDWTTDINDCDGFNNIRWRITLVSNLNSMERPRIMDVQLPFVSN